MITEKDVREAIAYCQGKLDPKRDDAILLAACIIIQREMFPESVKDTVNFNQNLTDGAPAYSYAAPPVSTETLPRYSGADTVGDYGESDFLHAVQGKDPAAMWAVMDELMETLKMVNPRVYDGVMRKIR